MNFIVNKEKNEDKNKYQSINQLGPELQIILGPRNPAHLAGVDPGFC